MKNHRGGERETFRSPFSVFRLLLVSLLQGIGCAEADEKECTTGERCFRAVLATGFTMARDDRNQRIGECATESRAGAVFVISVAILEETALSESTKAHSENDCD